MRTRETKGASKNLVTMCNVQVFRFKTFLFQGKINMYYCTGNSMVDCGMIKSLNISCVYRFCQYVISQMDDCVMNDDSYVPVASDALYRGTTILTMLLYIAAGGSFNYESQLLTSFLLSDQNRKLLDVDEIDFIILLLQLIAIRVHSLSFFSSQYLMFYQLLCSLALG